MLEKLQLIKDCKMANRSTASLFIAITAIFLLHLIPLVHGWGLDGHHIVCRIAESRLSKAAKEAVKSCYRKVQKENWGVYAYGPTVSSFVTIGLLLFITLTHLMNSVPTNTSVWDCKDENGEKGRCVAGAIYNFTTQLLTYKPSSSLSRSEYNLTEALLFLSHFMGDIHQPLHVGFTTDKGGNTIDIHWYTRKQNLHHVWDTNIIETAEEQIYDSKVEDLIDAIKKNITTEWADQVKKWETCSMNKTTCPNIYAAEGIKAACEWAYKGVTEGSTLEDKYFYSRLPIVAWRLAQGGVRLAATLNRIFG